jgi:hypothetical protein
LQTQKAIAIASVLAGDDLLPASGRCRWHAKYGRYFVFKAKGLKIAGSGGDSHANKVLGNHLKRRF